MKIVLAPNALKGSLTAAQAADAMRAAIADELPEAEVYSCPVADGGDGLLDALSAQLQCEQHNVTVNGPLGAPLTAGLLYCPDRRLAVIEMATASGLALLPADELDAMNASSEGVGQLMKAALDLGCRHLVLGIGGSASSDGGTGMAAALGMRFLDRDNRALRGSGATLAQIDRIDSSALDPRLAGVHIEVACDVDNPLLGESGAAAVYAPQKGASRDEVAQLEHGLDHLATLIRQSTGTDVRALAGGGAAGGMGAGLVAFFDAVLKPGARLVLDLLGVEAAIADADLVLTCEGRLDAQTRFGKAPAAVAAVARRHGVPCIAIAGSLDDSAYQLHDVGFTAVFSLSPGPVSLDQAVENAEKYLIRTTREIIRCRQPAATGQATP